MFVGGTPSTASDHLIFSGSGPSTDSINYRGNWTPFVTTIPDPDWAHHQCTPGKQPKNNIFTSVVDPGSYGDLKITSGTALGFGAGDYVFCNVSIDRQSFTGINPGARFFVINTVKVGGGSTVGEGPGPNDTTGVQWFVEAKNVKLSTAAVTFGRGAKFLRKHCHHRELLQQAVLVGIDEPRKRHDARWPLLGRQYRQRLRSHGGEPAADDKNDEHVDVDEYEHFDVNVDVDDDNDRGNDLHVLTFFVARALCRTAHGVVGPTAHFEEMSTV